MTASIESFGDSSRQCVKADYLPFFQNFTQYEQSNFARLESLNNTCREIEWPEMNEGRNFGARLVDGLLPGLAFGILYGRAAASFSTLENTELGRNYMAELKKIRKNPNALARIKAVYELAARHSGTYDYESNGMRNLKSGAVVGAYRPENLLASAKRNGTIGVCREFAGLLEWSLMQVGRYEGSKNAALDTTDFSVDMMAGTVPGANGWKDGGGHAWVRVNIPVQKNGGIDFTHVELDTTWYGDNFTPLFPRRSGVTEKTRKRAAKECRAIQRCLIDSANAKAPKPKATPNARSGLGPAPATN